jgi:hypothetical protein
MTTNRLHREQTGLVGKIAVVWLLIGALFIVAAFDGIAIAFTKYRVEDLAANAASVAAQSYKASGKADASCEEAIAYVTDHDKEAHVPTDGCSIDPSDGVASVTVRKVAGTIVAQRLSFTRDYTHLESTQSAEPPI